MGVETTISWTDHTFNPWWGCVRVSPACENCYAEQLDRRWFAGGAHWGVSAPRRFFGEAHWKEPLRWNAAARQAGVKARVFCASMADVAEDRRDLDPWRERLWELILRTPWLDWQLLTKRPEHLARLAPGSWRSAWPLNVWVGTTAEDQRRLDERLPHLVRIPARVRFLSCEPLLGAIDLARPFRLASADDDAMEVALDDAAALDRLGASIEWVIVGGESGYPSKVRAFDVAQARGIIATARAAGVKVFVKQLGRLPVDHAGALTECSGRWVKGPCVHRVPLEVDRAHGEDPSEWPVDLRVREYPRAGR